MPSFVTREESPIYNSHGGVVHLDLATDYDLPPEKLAHGKVNGSLTRPSKPMTSNDSFEDSSILSAHTSEASDTQPSSENDGMATTQAIAPGMSPAQAHLAYDKPSRAMSSFGSDSINQLPNPNVPMATKPRVDRYESPGSSPPPPPPQQQQWPYQQIPQTNGAVVTPPIPSSKDGSVPSTFSHRPSSNNPHIRSSTERSSTEHLTRPVKNAGIRHDVQASERSRPSSPRESSLPPPPASKPPSAPPSQSLNSTSTTTATVSAPFTSALPNQTSNGGLKHRHTLEVPRSSNAPSYDAPDPLITPARHSSQAIVGGGGGSSGPRASLSLAIRNSRQYGADTSAAQNDVHQDEDARRWAEAYRQKLASKRKRRGEDDDRVLVGTKVDENHTNWVAAYNMLTGIRVSVSRTNAKLDRPLTNEDFVAKQKSTFDITGNELVPSTKYDFKFKDYAPWVFRHLRALFRLDPADYLMSLTGKYILSELGSPGKSGSFFYFSRDYKYIIKTIHHAEHKFLRKILKDYYDHVEDNPNTLLSQFYGLHRVKMPPYGRKIHFVVMNNLFPPHKDIHQTFDLKGSTVGRDYREDWLADNSRATLKDLNWLRRKRYLEFGLRKKQLFLEQLRKDVTLMQKLQIMDYSLLIGIHDLQRGNEENLRDKTLRVFNPGGGCSPDDPDHNPVLMRTSSRLESQRKAKELRQMIKAERPIPVGQTNTKMPDELNEAQSRPGFVFNKDDGGFRATHENNTPGDEIYYLGVIDCLTHYGMIKKIEHFWKGLMDDRSQISALPPHEYGERFFNFVSGVTMSPEEARRLAQQKDEEAQRAAAVQPADQGRQSAHTHQTSPFTSPQNPSNVYATLQRAEDEARRTSNSSLTEEDIPDRTLRTSITSANYETPLGSPSSPTSVKTASSRPDMGNGNKTERRGSTSANQVVLPVLEEAAEGSTGGRSNSRASTDASHDTSATGRMQPEPLTPPATSRHNHTSFPKPNSADSGYSDSGATDPRSLHRTESERSCPQSPGTHKSPKGSIPRHSLDKALPPIPRAS